MRDILTISECMRQGGGEGGGAGQENQYETPIIQYCRSWREDYESAFKIKIWLKKRKVTTDLKRGA